MRISRAGDHALLIDLGTIDAAELHARAVAMKRVPGVVACIVGAQSLYVVFDHEPALTREIAPGEVAPAPPRSHTIDVKFDGADLSEFLAAVAISRDAFLSRVAGLSLRARYLGFRAGFAYLDGWPAEWAMPRRPTSRTRVPRGSFAIAGAVAGFYPIDSPGGWNLLGRTDTVLWDARRTPPHLIAAGDEVTIVPVVRALALCEIAEELPASLPGGVEVIGRLSSIVGAPDWGRVDEGRSPGGPFDPEAAAHANALVGNAAEAPLVECAMLGPHVRFAEPRVVAWCGADCGLPQDEPFVAKDELHLARLTGGLRGWLAIGGGPDSHTTSADPSSLRDRGDRLTIRVLNGPHDAPQTTVVCEVTPQLDRVGIRLRPLVPVPLSAPADLPSCGMQFGTVQLHPDGSLIAMGPDHPVTGGYLQPFTVRWDERWKLAQLSPGERVAFTFE